MNREQLREHPAYKDLSPEERAAIDERLAEHHLDAPAVAATTGGLAELDADDLRYWLRSTARRPYAMVTLKPRPQQADAIFDALIAVAPEIAERDDRAELVDIARDLARALVVADEARDDDGFVRDEQLAALLEDIDRADDRVPSWDDDAVFGILRDAGFDALADGLAGYVREHRGVRGFLTRVGKRIETKVFDLVHASLFVATGSADHEGHYEHGTWRNWTANYSAEPQVYAFPRSEDELRRTVAEAGKLRVVGGGHSFNAGPLCSDRMLTLDGYDRILELDVSTKTARVQAGIRLRDLNKALWDAGLGLPVLGSTDAQSLGGLIATDLHGTGRDHGFLSEQILSVRVIDADGQVRTVARGDDLFHAAIGAIGTCGVVIEATLQLVDAYRIEKRTTMVDRVETEANIDELLAANEHVSFYYIGGAKQGEAVRMHCWNRTDAPLTDDWEKVATRAELADFAISAYMPKVARTIANVDEDAWLSDALAPDKRVVMPGSRGFGRKLFYRHDEIEFGVPYEDYQDCLAKILALLTDEKFFSVVEVRFTPDTSASLIGPGVGRRTAYIELATPLSQDRDLVFAKVEDILRFHGGQPHLGKKTTVSAQDMLEIHGERFERFQQVRARQDPGGKFLNAFTERVFGD